MMNLSINITVLIIVFMIFIANIKSEFLTRAVTYCIPYYRNITARSDISCASVCDRDPVCKSFGYHGPNEECRLSTVQHAPLNYTESSDTQWHVYNKGNQEPVSPEGPDAWVRFGGSCYHYGDTTDTFVKSMQYCVQFGAELTNIQSDAENEYIRSLLADSPGPTYWIGLTDELIEDDWKLYPSQQTAPFLDFYPGEPNQGSVANCGAVWNAVFYHWIDEPCYHVYKPLCEMA